MLCNPPPINYINDIYILYKRYPLITKAIIVLFLGFFIITVYNRNLSYYSVVVNAYHDIIIGFFAGIFTFYFSIAISRILKKTGKTKTNGKNRSIIKEMLLLRTYVTSLIFAITYIAFSSIAEEIFFRSIVLYYLIQKFGVLVSVLFSSLLYSFIHFNSKYIQLFLMGVMYSTIVIYTNNLLPAILAHFVHNMMTLIFFSSLIQKKTGKINE